MKLFLTLLFAIFSIGISHSQRLIDREGIVHFYSKAPLEDIEAVNRQALAAIDGTTGEVAVTMLMRGFEFEKSLMQEHFNENYMESGKYPKATFIGNIQDFNGSLLNPSEKISREVIGDLTIHGVTRKITAEVIFEKKSGVLHVTTNFKVTVADHEIEIPTLVIKNIAEVVDVTAEFSF
ncbi:YceI family protein [Fulvivirga sedimenti]|uniref:YceI family protein n=1 Tax=Fulvivirga sedimenti TaxID=2879465 RepID=A0A9X1HRM3_9BACT|nr:YceI family protein [Fulvivirga sedimenti]MCA6074551.1 YceI family protein [Fulvivirga sedimenti]MCA6075728.1 YceI family protein [Fulvivirga sedimenti]MCA6076856.1 YceI family protein [Fulvivirga sedimenti]